MTKQKQEKSKKQGKYDVRKAAGASTKARDLPTSYIGEGRGQYRSNQKIRRLNMYNKKVKRGKKGQIVSGGVLPQNQKIAQGQPARVEPSRNWFQNTRVIGQSELTRFRDALKDKVNDPYTVLLKSSKVPYALLDTEEDTKLKHIKVKKQINFKSVFGEKSTRKKANIDASSIEDLVGKSQQQSDKYDVEKDTSDSKKKADKRLWGSDGHRHNIFTKGTSKRIWNELYKVVDSSDVLIEVLDARDPLGSRCRQVEKYLKQEKPHKHLIFVLNKCDLVPTWTTVGWVKELSKEFPTLAFHASITNPFGKGSLIQLLRQFSALHKDKKSISVGFIGYPNVGKSSIINTLKKKKVCTVAPLPGETKVWQYVSLMSRIHLVDCPGVTYPQADSDTDLVLRGVVRAEKIPQASFYAKPIIERVKPEYLIAHYGVAQWNDYEDFLRKFAQKSGRLLSGGDPDVETVAKKMIYDWQRGKIPWFVAPPFAQMKEEVKTEEEGDNASGEEEVKEEDGEDLKEEVKEESEEDEPNKTPFAVPKQEFNKLKVNSEVGLDAKDRLGMGYLTEDQVAENRLSTRASKKRRNMAKREDTVVDFDAIMDTIDQPDDSSKRSKKRKRRENRKQQVEDANVYIPSAVLKRRKMQK